MSHRALQTAAVLLGLCGTPSATGPPGAWLDVPFVRQEKNGCGAASVAMVMQYWLKQQGRPAQDVDPERIYRALSSGQARGTYASDLEVYLRQQGFRTFAFRGRWDDFRQHLAKGRPLIVALQASGDDLHYVVVTGMDWDKGLIMVNDPARRKLLRQGRQDFEQQWKAAGNWTLLAVPQGEP